MLVDELRGLPDRLDVDARVVADAGERLGERLGRDAVGRERDRVDRTADQVDSGARRLERERQGVPARALAVEAHREAGELAQLGDELARAVRLEQAGRVVEHDARGADLRHPLRRLDQCVVPARAVQQAGVELAAREVTTPRRRPCRLSASFSGSCRRNESIPLAAALAMKRRTRSSPTGRDPTRKRPRTASMSGVVVRALIARIRSHGLSTPLRTAASNAPPPETSRKAYPAPSRISASRSSSAVGIARASGSCESTRIEVSTSLGINAGP